MELKQAKLRNYATIKINGKKRSQEKELEEKNLKKVFFLISS